MVVVTSRPTPRGWIMVITRGAIVAEGIRLPPSEYLKRCHFDTLVYSSAQLEALIKRWGADHLCLGSDYPFDMEEPDPVGFHRGLDDATLNLILGGNAEHLLGLASERSHQ